MPFPATCPLGTSHDSPPSFATIAEELFPESPAARAASVACLTLFHLEEARLLLLEPNEKGLATVWL